MSTFWQKHNLFKRLSAIALIFFLILSYDAFREVLAYTAQSASYRLNAGTIDQGGGDRNSTSFKLTHSAIGESCAGVLSSTTYRLKTGFVSMVQSNKPVLRQNIPYQHWPMNTVVNNAFVLDDYFYSPQGLELTYTVTGNSAISVNIDPATHAVSFDQPEEWGGVEKVYFIAKDSRGNETRSNHVVLQVENTAGPDAPVITAVDLSPASIKEGDLVTMTVEACDLDDEEVTFSYNAFFTETRRW
ncbi:MAG: hypothetical protein ABH858_04780, partial [Candidatus Omnitrophota bacterium]